MHKNLHQYLIQFVMYVTQRGNRPHSSNATALLTELLTPRKYCNENGNATPFWSRPYSEGAQFYQCITPVICSWSYRRSNFSPAPMMLEDSERSLTRVTGASHRVYKARHLNIGQNFDLSLRGKHLGIITVAIDLINVLLSCPSISKFSHGSVINLWCFGTKRYIILYE